MKMIEFIGNTLDIIRGFPVAVKREAGYQLDRAQHGLEPTDWKPMPSIGPGIREIRIRLKGQYRIIYVATFKNTIYALHAFRKKSQKTSTRG